MKKPVTFLLFLLFLGYSGVYGEVSYNIRDFGATGNSTVLETKFIQSAIDKASENGGGIVIIPPGIYKVGCIKLKDNINFHITAGATLLGSSDIRDYSEEIPSFESRTNGLYVKYSVIYAEDAKNISITGTGTIYGNGDKHFLKSRPQNLRPFLIRLVNCQNVKIQNVRLLESANWTCHLLGCKDVLVDGVNITASQRENRDGIDIDGCNRVIISNCRISTGDDAIVLKSTSNALCSDVTITNCQVSSKASGIKIGTESNGGFRNIAVSNCLIRNIPVHTGIEFMTVDGGIMQNIAVDNIVMQDVATPIFVLLGNRARPYKIGQYVRHLSTVSDISFNNISVFDAKLPSIIAGMYIKKVRRISLQNIDIRYNRALAGNALAFNKVPLNEFAYPMGSMFGTNLPVYGFYFRNAEMLYLQNINLQSAEGEKRPALAFDSVDNVEMHSVRASVNKNIPAMIHLRNCRDFYGDFCRSIGSNPALFSAEKKNCANLQFSNSVLQSGQREIKEVPALQNINTYEHIDTESDFKVTSGNKIYGRYFRDLKKPLKVTLHVKKKGTPQVCLLTLNTHKKPENIILRYNGHSQEFLVEWNEWGWAPIALEKKFDYDKNVTFEIQSESKNSGLKIAEVAIRYLYLGYTD